MNNQVLIQFIDNENIELSDPIQVPMNISRDHLFQIIPNETTITACGLFVHGHQIINTLEECVKSLQISQESTIPIKMIKEAPSSKPAIFCNSSYSGHEQAVLKVKIVNDKCITAGGDGTVRIWNLNTKLTTKIIKVSDHWVGSLDACSEFLVSGCMSGNMCIIKFDNEYETKNIKNHDNKGISSVRIGWIDKEPFVVSGGRDGKVNIYRKDGSFISSYSHNGVVDEIQICNGLIYTAGRDMKIKIYSINIEKTKIKLVKEIKNHTKRINCIRIKGNILATASDDHKVYIYSIKDNYKNIRELIHKNIVTSIDFSENNLYIASCGYDKMVRVWDLQSGNSVTNYFHVGPVYKILFASNLLISISKDKTVKTFCIKKKKIISSMVCGDEIFDVDYKDGVMICGCRDKKVYFFA